MRKTKIVCTLGPASADEKVMEAMLRAGMNVARFNFSHGTHESHREMMQRFRAVRDRLGVAAAVMLDTKGPEIRLKDMAGGEAMLTDGAEFTLTARDVQGDAAQVSITYAELPREVKAGDRILIDIPNNKLEVLVSDEELAARKAKWQPREPKVTTGYLARYAKMVTSGNRGAILEK